MKQRTGAIGRIGGVGCDGGGKGDKLGWIVRIGGVGCVVMAVGSERDT